jgi:cytoskeletal protein CcmA (bactofilin family)
LSLNISKITASGSAETAEGSAAMFVDTRGVFDKWLRSLNASPKPEHQPARRDAGLESFQETNCDVTFDGVLQIDSLVKGNIRSAYGTLMMSRQGRVEADVDVRIAIIDGCLEGKLRATEHVVLESSARVSGEIHTPSLEIKDGAVFEGTSFFIERGKDSQICTVDMETVVLQASAVGA